VELWREGGRGSRRMRRASCTRDMTNIDEGVEVCYSMRGGPGGVWEEGAS
jgi:hypothetical protein